MLSDFEKYTKYMSVRTATTTRIKIPHLHTTIAINIINSYYFILDEESELFFETVEATMLPHKLVP